MRPLAQASEIRGHLLLWAREAAGLTLEEAAARAKLKDTRKSSAAAKLQAWENGDAFPTQKQAITLAMVYRRPFLTFFLDRPPAKAPPVKDFRQFTAATGAEHSLELGKLLRDIRARHDEVRELLLEDENLAPVPFVGKAKGNTDAAELVQMIRIDLELRLDEQLKAKEDLFELIRSAAEAKGIFVQLVGNLGSHHSNIPATEFRGFVIADSVAPFVVINPNDAKFALVFTLVHELAHLWLGEEGISNASPFDDDENQPQIEALCNSIAAELLLPEDVFLQAWSAVPQSDVQQAISTLHREFGVSHTAVAYRLWKLDAISSGVWWQLHEEYRNRWEAARAKEKSEREESKGPSYFVVKQHKLGKPIIRLVGSAIDAGELSPVRAARILGIKPLGIAALREAAGG